MDKAIWFFYGLLTGLGVVLLGIIGWGFNMLRHVISLAPLGFMVVLGICAFLYVVFMILKPSEKKQIAP